MKKEHEKLFRDAREGNSVAQLQLFVEYSTGKITGKPDFEKAFEWGDKAASNGNAEAQFYYYRMLSEIGLRDKATEWLLESAKNGYVKSQGIVSFMYYLDKDKESARYWANKAYSNGEKTNSPFVLALLLTEEVSSNNNISDKIKIVEYLKEAANNGNKQAESMLKG